ncbi:MAG: chemotaxis protein CheW [Candidatus Edwardsbacteria bacterium]|nr:chemotaxis protein CheW [Candidatus Edwardsbacteria bacterium]
MQLLTFLIGSHRLAVLAQRVLSVGHERKGRDGAGSDDAIDLAAVLDLHEPPKGTRPVIRFDNRSQMVELRVDRILALHTCEDGAIQPWPALLKPLAFFTGAVAIDGRLFQVIDLGKIAARRKGRRR